MKTCHGKFDRRNSDCAACPEMEQCRTVNVLCYGKAYSRKECADCPFVRQCGSSFDIHFHDGRHGEPSIVTYENLSDAEVFAEEPESAPVPSALGDALSELFRICRFNPLTVAAVIARHSGVPYAEIGASLGITKQAVEYLFDSLESPALREYLRSIRTSKHTHGVRKEESIRFALQPGLRLTYEEPPKKAKRAPDFEQGGLF